MVFLLSKWFLLLASFGALTQGSYPEGSEALHPFYVSVTEINHNAAEKTLEISCKFFADDFEHVLEKAFKAQLDITAEKDKASFDGYIPAYINKHFSLVVDGKAVKLNYVGYEKEKESVYCYFEVANAAAARRLDITNNLLYDLTAEQINIMHITVGGKRQSGKLSYPDVKASYQF
ncbi:MAG TPA: DUF6702 family protein [Flavisolibacter sp.]